MTRKDSKIEHALNRAVAMEEQSISLYSWAAEMASSSGSRRLLEELALEEQGHKEKLQSLMKDERKLSEFVGSRGRSIDLKIVDGLVDVKLSKDMEYQEILIYAGKREKITFDYYNSLSMQFRGTEVGSLLEALADEELSHKYRIERLYDDEVLREG